MSPLIVNLVAISPFSPINHIWFDLTDISGIEKKMGEKFPGQTLKDLVEGGLVEKFPLPFELIWILLLYEYEQERWLLHNSHVSM